MDEMDEDVNLVHAIEREKGWSARDYNQRKNNREGGK
jgi:hypothetical protein